MYLYVFQLINCIADGFYSKFVYKKNLYVMQKAAEFDIIRV